MTTAASDQLKGLVWNGLLNAHYMATYYGYLANRLARREKILTGLIVGLSSGAVVTLTSGLTWPYVAEACGLISASLPRTYSQQPEPGCPAERLGSPQVEWPMARL